MKNFNNGSGKDKNNKGPPQPSFYLYNVDDVVNNEPKTYRLKVIGN